MYKKIAAVLLAAALCTTGCSLKEEAVKIMDGGGGGHAPSNASTIASEISKISDAVLSVEVEAKEDPILFIPGKPESVTIGLKDMPDEETAGVIKKIQDSRLNWLDEDAVMKYMQGGEMVFTCSFNEVLDTNRIVTEIERAGEKG